MDSLQPVVIVQELAEFFRRLSLLLQSEQSVQESALRVRAAGGVLEVANRVQQGHRAARVPHYLLDEEWLCALLLLPCGFGLVRGRLFLVEHVPVLRLDLVAEDGGDHWLRQKGRPHLGLEAVNIVPLIHDTREAQSLLVARE